MSKILLVDTNFSSYPIYQYLVNEGHEVYTIGGNPEDNLTNTDNYLRVDYSDINRMQVVLRTHEFDYLIPGCTDQSYLTCAALESSGVDSLDVSETINNKQKFRAFCLPHNIPAPDTSNPDYPVIVKPVDAYSGRGVTVVHEGQDIASAMKHARDFSKTKAFVIEQYIKGQLYSHSAFIENQDIKIDFFVEEHTEYFSVTTSKVVSCVSETVRESVTAIAKLLNLKDGLIHTQFIKNEEGVWLIEVTRRCPGDLYSRLIELSTGFNYVENYVRPFLKESFNFNTVSISPIMRHTVKNDVVRFLAPTPVQEIVPTCHSSGRSAILFLRAETQEELNLLFDKTIKRELYE